MGEEIPTRRLVTRIIAPAVGAETTLTVVARR
jgi:hypothetical protein